MHYIQTAQLAETIKTLFDSACLVFKSIKFSLKTYYLRIV